MVYSKLASAIQNDIVTGLRGITNNPTVDLDQLEDEIVEERLTVIKEYALKNILPKQDLMVAINCIILDCESLDRCPCDIEPIDPELVKHFQIPQTMNDFGIEAINYVGSTDRYNSFYLYTTSQFATYQKYRKIGKHKPYVYIDLTPNRDGYLDGFVFNAPLLKQLSVVMIPKDARQLELYSCCDLEPLNDSTSFLNTEIKKRIIEKKIRYYRQFATPILPNDQIPK